MSDITKVSETRVKDDDGDWDAWPYPTITIESEVTGELRGKIIAKAGGQPIPGRVTIIESKVSGGYSEYTQENDYSIKVLIDGASVWENDNAYSTENAMSSFLNWIGEKA